MIAPPQSALTDDRLRPDHDPESRRFSDTRLGTSADVSVVVEERAPGGVYHISVADPLEANIRELLALDAARHEARTARSLPNLRASRESLLPAPPPPPAS